MPVLPPTAASTMPSSVVGTCTTRTPRSQVAATKPPRSVVAPPPTVTTASDRVNPARPSASQHCVATSAVLAASPSGTGRSSTSKRSPSSTVRSPAVHDGVHDRDPSYLLAEEVRDRVDDAAPDHHVVRRGGLDPDRGHEVTTTSTAAATCSGLSPSVSTTYVASPS